MAEDSPQDGINPQLEFTIQHKVLPTSHYSNHMMIQGDEECMYLHFFQIRPPVILASMVDGEASKTVVAEPIICIAVDIAKMERFVSIMQESLIRIKEKENATSDPL